MTPAEIQEVMLRLRRESRHNLLLLDIVADMEDGQVHGFSGPEIVVARTGETIVGVASLRPSMILDAEMGSEGLDAVLPFLSNMDTGLIKSLAHVVDPLWESLRARGRRSLLDRYEECHVLEASRAPAGFPDCPPGARLRRANPGDLEALVFAARSSLREEDRQDPFDGDPQGFRRWVEGRIGQARLLEVAGRPVFVGYADVRRPEGWLFQGVYTWPDQRRRGYGRAGMLGMVQEAIVAGAEHVQLAVVEGNLPALALYRSLGFEPFSRLRTLLFR